MHIVQVSERSLQDFTTHIRGVATQTHVLSVFKMLNRTYAKCLIHPDDN